MSELKEEYRQLSGYRLEKAGQDLESAKRNFDAGDYRTANNRAYYCILHSLRAVVILEGFDSKKHSGIISEFRKQYIKMGVFDEGISDMVGAAFEIRNASDYDDMYVASKKETQEQIQNAEKVFSAVEKYLDKIK